MTLKLTNMLLSTKMVTEAVGTAVYLDILPEPDYAFSHHHDAYHWDYHQMPSIWTCPERS